MPKYPISKLNKVKYDSPSGFVNVGKYIPPFEPVKDGYGYMGVIVEDWKSGRLQCHICGGWFEVFNSHLFQVHKINSNEYRKKFGLSVSTALKSKRIRLIQSKVMIKLNKENPKCFHRSRAGFTKNNNYAGNMKGKHKSLEHINKFGVCEFQIIDKVMKLKKKMNGKTPTLIDLHKEYGRGFIWQFHKRYSGYLNFCKENGLELNYSSHNPKYSREYFIEKGLSNEASIRILTTNEGRALYKYFKGGVNEWRKAVKFKKEKEVEIINAINTIRNERYK
jgi:hypothetical protein